MNRAYRRSLIRRIGKDKAMLLFRSETAQTQQHPLRLPKDWTAASKPTTVTSRGLTVTLPPLHR